MKILQLFVAVTVTILAAGCNNAENMKTEVPEISAFPTGKSNVAYEQYFSGRSWLAPLTSMKELNVPVSNVTFEPGCRNNWHSHTGGQLLICVGGEGYYQEKGKPIQVLNPGDVVAIPADVVHWHGAASDSGFTHIAINTKVHLGATQWYAPVTEEEYNHK